MADLSISAVIDRTELSLATLNVNDATNYVVFAIGLGPRTWKHDTADEKWVDGEKRTHSKLAEAKRTLGVRVKGTTLSNWGTAAATLIAALSQSSYKCTFVVDGLTIEWRDCGPGDLQEVPRGPTEGESLDRFGLMARQQDLLFTIPSDPADYLGPW